MAAPRFSAPLPGPGRSRALLAQALMAQALLVATGESALVLLQQGAFAVRGFPVQRGNHLPRAKGVMATPSNLYKKIGSQVEALEQRIAEAQQQDVSAANQLKARHKRLLKEQQEDIHDTAEENLKIGGEIKDIDRSIGDLRVHTEDLVRANKVLTTRLRALHESIPSAEDFIGRSLRDIEQEMSRGPEAAASEAGPAGAQALAEDGLADELALLQVGVQRRSAGPQSKDAQDLLQTMQTELQDFESEQNASHGTLEKFFESGHHKGERALTNLRLEQGRLNATRAKKLDMKRRLAAVSVRLEDAHNRLEERLEGARRFLPGGGPPAQRRHMAFSLLQVGAALGAEGPESTEAARALVVDARVSALKASLAALAAEETQAFDTQKAAYVANLTAQERDNRALERFNVKCAAESRELERTIATSRERAGQLAKALTNITIAGEFIGLALTDTAGRLGSEPELLVLSELDRADEEAAAAQRHASRLAEVVRFASTAPAPALLQIGADATRHRPSARRAPPSTLMPHEILRKLAADLDGLEQVHDSTEDSLRHTFEVEYVAGVQRRLSLLAEQDKLNKSKVAHRSTNARLDSAVAALDETHRGILMVQSSLASFMRKIAIRPSLSSAVVANAHEAVEEAEARVKSEDGSQKRPNAGANSAERVLASAREVVATWLSQLTRIDPRLP